MLIKPSAKNISEPPNTKRKQITFIQENCGLFVIILHSAACGYGIYLTYFLPASPVTQGNKSKVAGLIKLLTKETAKENGGCIPKCCSRSQIFSSLASSPLETEVKRSGWISNAHTLEGDR
jgi:hypothetical protein